MTDTTSLLTARAAQAWAYMTQPENPMPAFAAIDFVMNDLTDDREQAKRAIYGAAAQDFGLRLASEKYATYPYGPIDPDWESMRTLTSRACALLARGEFDSAGKKTEFLADEDEARTSGFGRWRSDFLIAIALCREVESIGVSQ